MGMKLTGNSRQPLLMTWLNFGGQRSTTLHVVKVAKASHRRWSVKVHLQNGWSYTFQIWNIHWAR